MDYKIFIDHFNNYFGMNICIGTIFIPPFKLVFSLVSYLKFMQNLKRKFIKYLFYKHTSRIHHTSEILELLLCNPKVSSNPQTLQSL